MSELNNLTHVFKKLLYWTFWVAVATICHLRASEGKTYP
jgi:hypothetical protein